MFVIVKPESAISKGENFSSLIIAFLRNKPTKNLTSINNLEFTITQPKLPWKNSKHEYRNSPNVR